MTEFIVLFAKCFFITLAVLAVLASFIVKSDDYGDSNYDPRIHGGLAGGAGVIF